MTKPSLGSTVGDMEQASTALQGRASHERELQLGIITARRAHRARPGVGVSFIL